MHTGLSSSVERLVTQGYSSLNLCFNIQYETKDCMVVNTNLVKHLRSIMSNLTGDTLMCGILIWNDRPVLNGLTPGLHILLFVIKVVPSNLKAQGIIPHADWQGQLGEELAIVRWIHRQCGQEWGSIICTCMHACMQTPGEPSILIRSHLICYADPACAHSCMSIADHRSDHRQSYRRPIINIQTI